MIYLYGVIDIGSNTMRFVIYRLQNGILFPMLNQKVTAGLASYISSKGKMKAAGIAEAIKVLQEFKQAAEMIHLEKLWVFGTAPLRNISNTEEVLQAVRDACGIEVRVLSGKEEALFDYYGALHHAAMEDGLLVDVGGGSTELVFFQEKKVIYATSLPMGSLNSYTCFIENIIPTLKELEKIRTAFQNQLQVLSYPAQADTSRICSVGGSARTILKLYNTLNKVNKYNLQYDSAFLEQCLTWLKKDPNKLKNAILKLAPDRIHTLLPGMMIFYTVVKFFNSQSITTSLCGVREGFLYHILNENPL